MADFNFLEDLAKRVKSERVNLCQVDEELKSVNMRLHELPLKKPTESTFAKMIGVQYEDQMEQLEKMKQSLESQKDQLATSIKKDTDTFITEMSSPELVIPLDPRPVFRDGNTLFHYRDSAKFQNLFDFLGELLGLSTPLVVKDVLLSSSEIIVKVSNEYDAKQKFISGINEIQKTLTIKKK